MRDYETTMMIAKVEQIQEYRKWCKELPTLNFEKEWNVKIIPPFGQAVIRFTIDYNGKHVSIYFDGYSELGWMFNEETNQPILYWEVYDGNDCSRYLLGDEEDMMSDIRKIMNAA